MWIGLLAVSSSAGGVARHCVPDVRRIEGSRRRGSRIEMTLSGSISTSRVRPCFPECPHVFRHHVSDQIPQRSTNRSRASAEPTHMVRALSVSSFHPLDVVQPRVSSRLRHVQGIILKRGEVELWTICLRIFRAASRPAAECRQGPGLETMSRAGARAPWEIFRCRTHCTKSSSEPRATP